MGAELEPLDRRLLDRVQDSVPLAPRPFAAIAGELGAAEADVLARLARLAAGGVLRQIGAIFDTRACGYASALVATRVDAGGIERAAAVAGAHPGVTHCYEREHDWNLWFTLAVSPTSRLGLDGTAAWLAAAGGAGAVRVLPAVRVFKIRARFEMDDGGGAAGGTGGPGRAAAPSGPLSPAEIAAVRALQRPLPLVPEPFAAAAADAAATVDELLTGARALLARGVMRRFAALLDHRRAGFGANVMAAWAVDAARVDAAGERIAEFPAVTHCYARPTFPDWPYGLFSMIHGRRREACVAVVDAIREAIRPQAAAALWTVREFKKTRLQLFTPDGDRWEAAVAGGAR